MNRPSIRDLLPVPERIDVKVGFACNNRCRFCVQGRKREKFGQRTFEEISAILENSRQRFDGVVFTGGEPTLHPQILKLVEKAKNLGFPSIQIQTNGRMFAYRSFCVEAIHAGVSEFSPGLHGHLAAVHDYLTTVHGSFDQTVQGIRNLKALGQRVITNSVITRSNFRHLLELAELLISLGVDQCQLAFAHPVGAAGRDANFASIVPRFERIVPFVHAAIDACSAVGTFMMTEAIPFCFMDGYEQYIGEKIMPRTQIFDAEGVIDDYRDYRLNQGKAKGPPCARCYKNEQCEGPWREYIERYGWAELKPPT